MAPTRELVITYAGYAVSPDGAIELDRDREGGYLSFSFVITGATEAAFASACQAAEEAFREPYGNLTVVQGAATLFSGSQTSRTFLDAKPSIGKGDHTADTGRSRRYTARIEFGLPADTGAEPYEGLRDRFTDVSTDAAKIRRVTITGTFTGVGSDDARTVYEATIATLVSDTLSDLGITAAEQVEEPSARTDTNSNLLMFTHVLREIVFSQGGGSLDDAEIVGQTLEILRRAEAPGDTPEATRFVTVDLRYEASVDAQATTNLVGKYRSIRPWLIRQMSQVLGESNPTAAGSGPAIAIISEEPSYVFDTNMIRARIVGVGTKGGSTVLERRVTTADRDLSGRVIVPVWSGRETDGYVYQGPRVVTRTLTYTERRLGQHTEQAVIGAAAAYVADARGRNPAETTGGNPGARWIQLERNPSATKLQLGLKDVGAQTIDVTESSVVYVWRYVTEPPAFSGGASAAPSGGGPGGATPGGAGTTQNQVGAVGEVLDGGGIGAGATVGDFAIDDDLGGDA